MPRVLEAPTAASGLAELLLEPGWRGALQQHMSGPSFARLERIVAGIDSRENMRATSVVLNPSWQHLYSDTRKVMDVDRRELVTEHQGLVRAIAHKISRKLPRNLELDDLIAYGMIGLVEASQRFDPNGGARFSSYAYYRIQGSIYDGLRKFGWLNRSEYAHVRAERGASDYLTYESDRHASVLGDDKRTLEEQVQGSADVIANLVTVFVTSLEGIEGFEPSHDGGEKIHSQVEKRQMQ